MHVEALAEGSQDAGSIPAASNRANLREIASWPFSLTYSYFLDFPRGLSAQDVEARYSAADLLQMVS